MVEKGDLYYPNKNFKEKAYLKDEKIYQEAEKNPIKFWEKLAGELFWFKKWEKDFEHRPPYFNWFSGGKINITSNIFEKNPSGFEKIKNKTALIWEPESLKEKPIILTYGELLKKVNKFANALKKLGIKKGDRVGIYLPMIPEALVSMLACARMGAVHTVVFSAFSPAALKIRLRDTGAKILITADGYFRRGKIINLKASADEGIKGTKIEKVIVVKRAGNEINWQKEKDVWWQEIIKKEKDSFAAEKMDAEDPLFILPESGTMGQYLQILHTTGGYSVQAYWSGKWVFDFKISDVFWSTADIGWVTGHTYGVYSPLLNGVTILFFEGAPDWPTPDRWAQIIEKYKVTIFYTAPTAVRMFKAYGKKFLEKHHLSTLRLLGLVGEPVDRTSWLWYFKEIGKENCPIVDTWWQTETGGIVISSLPAIGPFKPSFSGLALPGIRIDIFDDEGKSCLAEKKGNLVILPPFCPGLLRDIYKDSEKYLKTYWSRYGKKVYFTADAALKDKNGLIRIVGRVDDVIKVAGHRLVTGEFENAIAKNPEIAECAVIGIPDKIKGEVPVVFAVCKTKEKTEKIKAEIVSAIRNQIGPIASPKEVYLVYDLPKTRSGKIVRRILKSFFTGEDLGDLSILTNPESVKKIKKIIKKIAEKVYE